LSITRLEATDVLALVDTYPAEGTAIVARMHFAVLTGECLRPGSASVALFCLS
jgi:hypothetical protein